MSKKSLPSDFCDTFMIFIRWSKVAGLDFLEDEPRVYKKYFLFIFCNLCSILLAISSLTQMIKFTETYVDIIRFFLCIIVVIQNQITLLVIACKSCKIKKMIYDIAELWPNYKQDGSPKAQLLNKWLRRYIYYVKAYSRFFLIFIVCFQLKPLPFTVYSYFTNPEPEYTFVFNLYKPWEITSLTRYILGISFDSITTTITHLCVHTSIVMILTALTHNISLLFRLLQIDLENCFESYSNLNEGGNCDENEVTDALVMVVNTHQKLLKLTQDLNDIFGGVILLSYVVSVVLMCSTTFLSVIVDSVNLFAAFIALAEIFSLSWPGQLLIEMSGNMAVSAYNSQWYAGSKKTSRIILMIIMRSQKPAILSGMGYCDSSLATFASVMRLSWSYFNLLIQVFRDKDMS